MRYCVDASVFVASISPFEISHEQSRRFVDEWELHKGALVCPEITLVEVAAAVARATREEQRGLGAAAYLKRAPGFQFIPFGSQYIARAVERAAHFRLRAADACYVTLAMRYRIPVVTLDREILRVAEQTGEFRAITPHQALDGS